MVLCLEVLPSRRFASLVPCPDHRRLVSLLRVSIRACHGGFCCPKRLIAINRDLSTTCYLDLSAVHGLDPSSSPHSGQCQPVQVAQNLHFFFNYEVPDHDAW